MKFIKYKVTLLGYCTTNLRTIAKHFEPFVPTCLNVTHMYMHT